VDELETDIGVLSSDIYEQQNRLARIEYRLLGGDVRLLSDSDFTPDGPGAVMLRKLKDARNG
jgi:hypothetical protein